MILGSDRITLQFLSGLSARAVKWTQEALDECGFDGNRLVARTGDQPSDIPAGILAGKTVDVTIAVQGVADSQIPAFGKDFATASIGGFMSSNLVLSIWSELAEAPPPFGGRLFFKETVMHALGHVVAQALAVGADPWKRQRVTRALLGFGRSPATAGLVARQHHNLWNLGFQPPASWEYNPWEWAAEAFKDIYSGTRRFENRTKLGARGDRPLAYRVFHEECQTHLPFYGPATRESGYFSPIPNENKVTDTIPTKNVFTSFNMGYPQHPILERSEIISVSQRRPFEGYQFEPGVDLTSYANFDTLGTRGVRRDPLEPYAEADPGVINPNTPLLGPLRHAFNVAWDWRAVIRRPGDPAAESAWQIKVSADTNDMRILAPLFEYYTIPGSNEVIAGFDAVQSKGGAIYQADVRWIAPSVGHPSFERQSITIDGADSGHRKLSRRVTGTDGGGPNMPPRNSALPAHFTGPGKTAPEGF